MDQINQVMKMSTGIANDAFSGLAYYITGKNTEPLISKPLPSPPMTAVQSKSTGLVMKLFGNASPWIRVAGLSGAIAVSMGAYGAHGLKNVSDDQRLVFETANRYHFIHTLAMLAVPLTNRPNLVGSLLVAGTLIFSGTCYMHGINGNTEIIRYTPYGGMALIAAWLAMII